MKIYLTDQAKEFPRLLTYLMAKPAMPFAKRNLKEKVTTVDIKSNKNLEQVDLDFLFNYKIFPANIMTYLTQWGMGREKCKLEIQSFNKR